MGTLGCINNMLQRDKENRELRKLSKERLKETRNRLMKIGSSTKLPDTSVEEMKEIRKKTIENIRGNTKSKTNYTYDIDIQQIKEDRKKYEKSQCFPFASHFGLKRG